MTNQPHNQSLCLCVPLSDNSETKTYNTLYASTDIDYLYVCIIVATILLWVHHWQDV